MDAETYPDGRVRGVIERHTEPVRLPVFQDRDLARRLQVYWTPTFLILDTEGRERHRALGYLPPPDFAARLLVGCGLARFQAGQFGPAEECFQEVIASYSETFSAPEAAYWRGVCEFKRTKDTRPIYEASRQIVEKYPGTEWAAKLGFVEKYENFNLPPR